MTEGMIKAISAGVFPRASISPSPDGGAPDIGAIIIVPNENAKKMANKVGSLRYGKLSHKGSSCQYIRRRQKTDIDW